MNTDDERDVTIDDEIGKILLIGTELSSKEGIERYDALKALYKRYNSRRRTFRKNYETALEDKLKKATESRDESDKAVAYVSSKSILNAWEKFYLGSVGSRVFVDAMSWIAEQKEGFLHLKVEVLTYVGVDNRENKPIGILKEHAKTVKKNFTSLDRVKFESIDGLYLERDSDPRILPPKLHPKFKKSIPEVLASAPFVVLATYTGKIPETMIPTIYEKYKQMPTKT